ncbi:hypothetical protein [Hymenobacter arizonensis]|nr:hypothetical protein [Hymenobacter arizonensis]
MRGLTYSLYLILCFTTACHYSSSFNQEVWIDNPEMSDTRNPRAKMVGDLMQNHLKTGMSREAVLNLLGKPYKDGIEKRLPKGVVIPDSLSFTNSDNLKRENQQKAVDGINEFYRLYSQPDTIMLYPVGWSTIDPNFLVVKLTGNGTVGEYWVEQH